MKNLGKEIVGAIAVLGLLAFLCFMAWREVSAKAAPAPAASASKRITFVAPTPAAVEIFWIDSAGNLGLRGAEAIVPGVPDPKAKITDSCRKSAAANGDGTLTVCMAGTVGRSIAKELGLEWTSGTSEKR